MNVLRRNPQFRRLFLAHAVSRSGDAFNTVAIVVLVFQLTGSGRGVAGAVMFEVLPVLLIGPFAGLAAAASLVFAVGSVTAVFAAAFVLSAAATVFNPAATHVAASRCR